MIVIHKEVAGEHNTDSLDCWCIPLKVDEDEPDEVIDEKVRIHALKD